MTAETESAPKRFNIALAGVALVAAMLVWAYWTTLGAIAWRWSADPQYSHGYLVPLFALYVLWLRRDSLQNQSLAPNAIGLILIACGIAQRLVGTRYHFEYLDQVSLLPCFLGLFLLAGGWTALRWSWPAVAFLAFMVPLPHSVSMTLSGPMQSLATTVSTFTLQVVGCPAIAEGNVILINDIELNIVEACSGLRMLVVFFALSTAVAMLIRKPLWEKLLIASSAIPIALVANVLRIAITGICYDTFGNHVGGQFFHDAAGWLMMPLGLAFLGIELWVLRKLLIDRPSDVAAVAQVAQQRVELNPVALYAGESSSRREKKVEVEPAPVPAPESASEPEPEPVAQS